MSIDIDLIKSNKNMYQQNYLALKAMPIFKTAEYHYLCLDRNFMINKLYTGLIFSFYQRSGVKEVFSSFEDYKSYIGEKISEQRLFTGILKTIFNKKHYKLYFDDKKGKPDCYLRYKNKIFLFEFKDNMMSSEVIDSSSYDIIKSNIDRNFIKNKKGSPKGISQITNHIEYLNTNSYDFDNLEAHKIDRNKLNIYPIIVYTDYNYSIPGVNKYLNRKFQELISETKYEYKTLSNLTFINLDFLYDNIPYLMEVKFDKALDYYHFSIKNKAKELDKKPSIPNLFQAAYSIENTILPWLRKTEPSVGYTSEKLFKNLKLTL